MHIKLITILYFLANIIIVNGQSIISPILQNKIDVNSQELIPVRIEFGDNVDSYSLNQYYKQESYNIQRRQKDIIYKLLKTATTSQEYVITYFDNEQISELQYKSFWIINVIVAKLRAKDIISISNLNNVSKIDFENHRIIPHDPIIQEKKEKRQVNGVENGLIAINIRPMWDMGYTGRGRLVYNYDTGVWPSHPAFKNRFIGNRFPLSQSWFGYFNEIPNGNVNNHGTHTLGTIAGLDTTTNDTIGCAFQAYWIANDYVTSTVQQLPPIANMIEAFQWALNPDGDTSTVYDIPDVINNSWRWYDDLDTLHCNGYIVNLMNVIEAAGIANIFSGGNFGPSNTSISSPQRINTSEVNTFCVGSINANASFPYPISSFSSVGPTQCPGTGSLSIHPEVVAPGQNIRSAWGNDSYNTISGTSMAAPHVSGAVLLLKEAFPFLSGEDLLWALYLNATDLGNIGEDNTYGNGLIDVYAAFLYLSQTYTPVAPNSQNSDLELSKIEIPNTNKISCENTITPNITCFNKGNFLIDTIEFNIFINDSLYQNYIWQGSLQAQTSINITLPQLNIVEFGNIDIMVQAKLSSNITEYDIFNNSLIYRYNKRSNVNIPFIEHFENGINDAIWYIENEDMAITWDTIFTNGLIWNNHSIGIKLFDYIPRANQKDGLITPQLSLNNSFSSYTLKFDVAYQKRSLSTQLNDTLRVYSSDDCGLSFNNLIYEKYGDSLSTLDTNTYNFIPQYSNHWRNDSIDLSYLAGKDILLKFESTNRMGNNLFIDNIKVYEGLNTPSSIIDISNKFSVHPNPSSEYLNITTKTRILDDANFTIFNNLGQKIISEKISNPDNKIKVSEFPEGLYIITLNYKSNIYSNKFIIKH